MAVTSGSGEKVTIKVVGVALTDFFRFQEFVGHQGLEHIVSVVALVDVVIRRIGDDDGIFVGIDDHPDGRHGGLRDGDGAFYPLTCLYVHIGVVGGEQRCRLLVGRRYKADWEDCCPLSSMHLIVFSTPEGDNAYSFITGS